jgi:hypothetical protein
MYIMDLNQVLKKEELQSIFQERTAKYLSQHDENRHYKITYNNDGTFTNQTYENNIVIGESYGTYNFQTNENGECVINVQYKYVFNSPNENSPFHINNPFYPKLENYMIGPFYTKYLNEELAWIPILYNLPQTIRKGFKILNFYKKKNK